MVKMNRSPRFRVENIDVNAVDGSTLYAIAKHYGFPELSFKYPDYSKILTIEPTREAWRNAVRYLKREIPMGTDMFKYTYLELYEQFAELKDDPLTKTSIVSGIFNDRTYLLLNEANKHFASNPELTLRDYYRVCFMLALAEMLNFPEIAVPIYEFTIPANADMEIWLDVAKAFYGLRPVVWISKRLIECAARGTPLPPKRYKSRYDAYKDVHGSCIYTLVRDTGGLRICRERQPIGSL